MALGAAPAHAATPFNIGSGKDADVLVDSAGNGHFAWIDGETVRYCRVPRGATACSTTSALALPAHSSAAVQGPVRIVRPISNGIVVIAQVAGAGNDGAWAYNSTNNGSTFPNPPTKIGTLGLTPGQFGGRLALGPGPAAVSDAALCCGDKPGYQRMPLTRGPASFPGADLCWGNKRGYRRMPLKGGPPPVTASFSAAFLPDIDVVTGLAGNPPLAASPEGATIFYRQYLNSPVAPSAN